ncbi:MAG: hypothetical protein J0L82_02570 [Deltaproteobacteria bacterium]|jgi:hypothetical protein|nr:hypothetical protein [Deltaproteobacteria bacterium]
MRSLALRSLFIFAVAIPIVALGSISTESRVATLAESLAALPEISDRPETVFLGHNATPSSYALGAGQITAGNFGIAAGITDQVTIATSPWLWASYEAANVHLKWITPRSNGSRIGAMVSYFETFDDRPFLKCVGEWEGYLCPNQPAEIVEQRRQANPLGYRFTESVSALPNRYQFQAITTHMLYGIDNGRRTYHFNLKFSYFFNDDLPYSIRIDPGTNEIKGQVDATVLIEHRFSSQARLNFETGFLGLNAIVPSGHIGFSAGWTSGFWLAQIGASATWRLPNTGPNMFVFLGESDIGFHTAKDGQHYYGGRYRQSSIHPEVQIQYFF